MDFLFQVRRLLQKFEQLGGAQGRCTRPFAALSPDVQSMLHREARFTAEEAPFLAFVADDEKWTVITLQRVVSRDANRLISVCVSDISDATIPWDIPLARGRKSECDRLKIVSAHGAQCDLVPLEPGKPFVACWNILKLMIAGHATRAGG